MIAGQNRGWSELDRRRGDVRSAMALLGVAGWLVSSAAPLAYAQDDAAGDASGADAEPGAGDTTNDAVAGDPGADAASNERASDDVYRPEPYARIIVASTPLRSGPGGGYRQVGVARRGDTFPIRRRGTRGYWFQVERPDATLAWVLGDAVYAHEVGGEDRDSFWKKIFAPPPLLGAHAEIAITFGSLGGGGFMALRPTIYIQPVFGFEITGAVGVSRAGRLLLAGIGGILNVFPEAPVVPYVVAGGGAAISDPNADTFLLESGTVAMMYGGGGLRFGFKYRLTIRIEARAYAFFEPDRYVANEEFSGGLTVFF